jgi:hypothetical protein
MSKPWRLAGSTRLEATSSGTPAGIGVGRVKVGIFEGAGEEGAAEGGAWCRSLVLALVVGAAVGVNPAVRITVEAGVGPADAIALVSAGVGDARVGFPVGFGAKNE